MIAKTAYETILGTAVKLEPIQKSILQALVESPSMMTLTLGMPGKNQDSLFVTGETSGEEHIPLFTHPIQVFNKGKHYIVSDLRLYLKEAGQRSTDRITNEDVEARIRNRTEYNFAKSRHAMQLLWSDDQISQIANSTRWAAVVFSMWISDSLQRAMALNYMEAEEVRVIAHMYYQSLFVDKSDSEEIERCLVHTVKGGKLQAQQVFDIWDQVAKQEGFDFAKMDLSDFAKALSVGVSGMRLQSMNMGLLITILRNSWYGTNAKDILVVALEHPPTWIALLYTAINERTYKTTSIAKVAEKMARGGLGDAFKRSYVELVNTVQFDPE